MYVTDPPCPSCGNRGVTVTRDPDRLVVTGPAQVAGVTAKYSAVAAWRWRCGRCGAYGRATRTPHDENDPGARS